MRQAQKRSFKNSLVIVCEGTETEYKYFEELASIVKRDQPDRFSRIKVVPTPEEKAATDARRSSYKRKMRNTTQPIFLYHVKEEKSAGEYALNSAQPARYVREAQLFMIEDGYSDGWAVFDKDIHTGHKRAWELASQMPRLKIAFSSYSFEEWILCHFERNSHAYHQSLCKRKDCGFQHKGCRGRKCLIGRIREKKYIPDFVKSKERLFANVLAKRLGIACVNAAWLRSLNKNIIPYQQNPYTNVDELVLRLLDIQDKFEWIKVGEIFEYEGHKFILHINKGEILLAYDGTASLVITPNRFKYCTAEGIAISAVATTNLAFTPDVDERRVLIDKSQRYLLLEEKSGSRPRMKFIIELPFFC
jgi:hypothetical protein